MSRIIPSALGIDPEHYERVSLKPGAPEIWEDGLRTDGKKGSFDWWYFDSKLDDGSTLVIVFNSGPMTGNTGNGFEPHCSLELTRADGSEYKATVHVPYTEDCFSKETCDVKLGECYFRGNLHSYEIFFKNDEIEAKVLLTGNVPAWRPYTGHIFFGEEDYFAWLPSVPEGTVDVSITERGVTHVFTGTGYHDHNWGNTPMMKLMHHWYWGRAKIGDYQVISSYIYGAKKYGYKEFPVFMLAKGDALIADQPTEHLTFTAVQPSYCEETGKHIHKTLVYDFNDGTQHYRITYQRESDLVQANMLKDKSSIMKLGARLMGLAPSYNRLAGTATLERFEGNTIVETVSAPAIWELMYFGTDRP